MNDKILFKKKYECKFTNWSPVQTCLRFSGLTSNRLQRECKVSNNESTKGTANSLAHFLYSFTSQMAHIAPEISNRQEFYILLYYILKKKIDMIIQ